MARQQYTPEEKVRLVLEAIRGERTINKIASEHNIHSNMLSRWKRIAESQMYTLFQDNSGKERKVQKDQEVQINELYTQIGRLTTQKSHFTNPQYTQLFLDAGVKISMDHCGRAYDNIFVERLWRTVNTKMFTRKHMRLQEARIGIHNFLRYYNHERPHFSIGYCTPEEMYWSR